MRVVLDTNVFISGVFFSGPPARILEAWQDGRIVPVVSPGILQEYRRVGDELAARYRGVDLNPMLSLLMADGEAVSDRPLDEPVSRDPHDDKFLGCAREAGAEVVVSGDKGVEPAVVRGSVPGLESRKPVGGSVRADSDLPGTSAPHQITAALPAPLRAIGPALRPNPAACHGPCRAGPAPSSPGSATP